MDEIETAKYTITGLVDYSDEQGNILGQLPVGSVQELPVVIGNKAVEAGQAELFVEEAEVGDAPTGETGATGEDEIVEDEGGEEDEDDELGETGEGEVE